MLLLLQCGAHAELKPNALFGDHAVLQREKPLPVWGTASPKSSITVELDQAKVTALADADGAWRVLLPAMKAGGPFTLRISGDGAVEVHDVMVGEVWLAAGQSNMAFVLRDVSDASAAIAESGNPNIRMFRVHAAKTDDPTVPQTQMSGEWEPASPETSPSFSAVAWFFAKRVQETLHVPVGIINNSVGGSPAEAWTSKATLLSDPTLAALLHADMERLQESAGQEEQYKREYEAWEQANHSKDPGGSPSAYVGDKVDTADWKKTALPTKPELLGLQGGSVVWFRADVTLDTTGLAPDATVQFGNLGETCVLYVNGSKVAGYGGIHDKSCANASFLFPTTAFHSGANTLVLRIYGHTLKGEHFGSGIPTLAFGQTKFELKDQWHYKVSYTGPVLSDTVQRALPVYTALNRNQVSILLYNQLLVPLSDYAIRGALWYQGEQNLTDPDRYRVLLPKMIADWRRQWHEDYPFYLVQLPNLGLGSPGVKGHLPLIRAVQADVATSIPNSGYVVTMDVGDPKNIHPTNKRPVGDRLAYLALAKTYGQHIEWSGPYPSKVTQGKKVIEIQFAHAKNGLLARNGPLGGFMIAGHDHVFVPGVATLHGKTVDVGSPTVASPEVVRYGWVDNPVDANLTNGDDLPAAPFSTDHLALP